MAKKVAILTGGGDCPGLNPAIRGAVMRGMDLGYEFVGLQEGWRGFIEAKTMPLTLKDVKEIVGKGGTILGSSRTNPFKKEGAPQKCLENFKKLGLHALIALGGEDTLGVANRFYKEHKLPVVGVPKTMDNDLSATDYTFGFDTAATISVDAAERLRDTGRSHRRIMVLEVMGRHAGWVALYTAIASAADGLLLPERKADIDKLCAHLKMVHARDQVAIVITSEAVELPGQDNKGEELDQFGHMLLKNRAVGEHLAELIEKGTGIETRSAAIGHIQRGGSPTLFDRILGSRVGKRAIELVDAGQFGQMVALRGLDVIGVSLEEATAKLKTVPLEWLQAADTFFK
jgi:ATP-dependent phosphofructokinase / diphosphate-dependent phosphofructokinase